jgi:rhamnose utilization protein RhaD (predicted bifunctional aldolase and dehydrogenase)
VAACDEARTIGLSHSPYRFPSYHTTLILQAAITKTDRIKFHSSPYARVADRDSGQRHRLLLAMRASVFASDSHTRQGQAPDMAIPPAVAPPPSKTSASEAPAELVSVSARIGGDPRLVQGGGGNTSLKRGDDFWVKASGTWLADAQTRDIFVRLPLQRVRTSMDQPDAEAALAALTPAGGLRPSIETSLHALLPHAVVLHVHSVNAIAWAARIDAEASLNEALQSLAWAWVPYRRPGLPLTTAIREALIAASTPPDILILGNHGVVVGGSDCDAAETLLHAVETRLALPMRTLPRADLAQLRTVNDLGWQAADAQLLDAIAIDPVCCAIAGRGALYPDHVVFLGERAMHVSPEHPVSHVLSQAREAGIAPPHYVVMPGAGILLSPEIPASARAMLGCLADVGLRVDDPEQLRYLDDDDVAALLGWEAEAYRRAREATPGRLHG